tara:strand:+ start:972 stop:1382 length:411 start_codon:yes stop_codon:yes gene_type:complete
LSQVLFVIIQFIKLQKNLFITEVFMLLENIERALSAGLALQTWDDNQSSGVWAALGGDMDALNSVQSFSKEGLQQNIWLKNFVQGEGSETLIVLADSFETALSVIETRLDSLPNDIYDEQSKYRQSLEAVYKSIGA